MKIAPLALSILALDPHIPVDPKPIIYYFNDDFDYIEVPVFVSGESNSVKFYYSFANNQAYDRWIYIYIAKYGDHGDWEEIYRVNFSARYINKTFTFGHNLPANCNTVQMRFVAEEMGNDITDKTFNVPFRQLGSVRIDTHNEYSTNSNALIYRSKSGIANSSESYEFNNFFTNYSPLNSYLDISQMTISYTGPKLVTNKVRELTYKEAAFTLDDVEDEFGEIGSYEPPYLKRLMIKLVKDSDETYHLAWDQKLYVDPLTLKMSNTLKDGYVETPYFYFPRNIDYLNNVKFIIFFRYLGMNKENFSISVRVDKSTPLVGYCGSSSYCLTTSQGTPNFEIGESVTYK